MIIINWNCRGAQGINFRQALNNFCRRNKVDIVALQETHCSGSIGKKTIKKLGFKNYVLSEARGFSEGIWLLWNKLDIQIQLIHNDFHYLHVQVQEKDLQPWLYGRWFMLVHGRMRDKILGIISDILHLLSPSHGL
jgi:exonuclease III